MPLWLCSSFFLHWQHSQMVGWNTVGAVNALQHFFYTILSQTVVQQAIQHWNRAIKQLQGYAEKHFANWVSVGEALYKRRSNFHSEEALKITYSIQLAFAFGKPLKHHDQKQKWKSQSCWGHTPWAQTRERWDRYFRRSILLHCCRWLALKLMCSEEIQLCMALGSPLETDVVCWDTS